jgi:branched-chain amino acid transport system substrate-binding protein
VAVGGHDVLLVDFVNAMAATGYTPKAIIEHYGVTDASFSKALGRQADGVMGISVWLPTASFKDDLFGSAADYAKTFEQKHSPPDYTAAGCSAAGQVLHAAVEKLGETPSLSEDARVKLNDLIAGTDLTTFYGPIRFASDGDHFHTNTALNPMLVQIQGGQVKAIAPKESAQARSSTRLPRWAELSRRCDRGPPHSRGRVHPRHAAVADVHVSPVVAILAVVGVPVAVVRIQGEVDENRTAIDH